MWCEQCQSDIATEISADGQQLLCTTCHQPVRKVIAPSLHPETRSAREFLERWAREQQGLRAGPEKNAAETPASEKFEQEKPSFEKEPSPPPIDPISSKEALPGTPIARQEESDSQTSTDAELPTASPPAAGKRKFRIDPQHTAPDGPMPSRQEGLRRPRHLEQVPVTSEESIPVVTGAAPPPADVPPAPIATPDPSQPRYRLDEAQATSPPTPHFNVRDLEPQRTVFPGRNEAIWGQLLAYAGVGLLTVGTIFVLWGYFGEIEQYASTGWLIATAGQMLLLLGIVTLVGGGMQQTTHEVTQRIEHLGGRIIRIEESTDKILQTPYFQKPRRKQRKHSSKDQEAA